MAQSPSGSVDMAQDIVLAMLAHHLFSVVASQPGSTIVPVQNAPFPVNKVHAITHVIQ